MYWKGSNKLCCRNKVLFGSSWLALWFTLSLLNIAGGLFFAFVLPYFVKHYSIGMALIPVYLIITTNLLLVLPSIMDPGIIPRRIVRMHKRYAGEEIFFRLNNLSDNYRMKFWSTCFIFRPPRTSHCHTCNNWVMRWDHHCPWMGTWIGRRNFKLFYWFLVHLFLITLYGFIMTLIHLFMVASDESQENTYKDAWRNALKKYPISLVLWIWITPALIFSIVLLTYHTYLSMIDETTNENVKHYYKGVPFAPYSSGFYFKNLFSRIFETTPISMLYSELRIRDKISVYETKLELESKFYLCKISLRFRRITNLINSISFI